MFGSTPNWMPQSNMQNAPLVGTSQLASNPAMAWIPPSQPVSYQQPSKTGISEPAPQSAPQKVIDSVQNLVSAALPIVTSNKPFPFAPPINSSELCAFFLRGQCKHGMACRFSHGAANADKSNVPVCKYWLQGMCKYDDYCMLQHPGGDNNAANPLSLIRMNAKKAASNVVLTGVSGKLLEIAQKRAEQARRLKEYEALLDKAEEIEAQSDFEKSNDEDKKSKSLSSSSDHEKKDTSEEKSSDKESKETKSSRSHKKRDSSRDKKSRRKSRKKSRKGSSDKRSKRKSRKSRSRKTRKRSRDSESSESNSSSREKSREKRNDSKERRSRRKRSRSSENRKIEQRRKRRKSSSRKSSSRTRTRTRSRGRGKKVKKVEDSKISESSVTKEPPSQKSSSVVAETQTPPDCKTKQSATHEGGESMPRASASNESGRQSWKEQNRSSVKGERSRSLRASSSAQDKYRGQPRAREWHPDMTTSEEEFLWRQNERRRRAERRDHELTSFEREKRRDMNRRSGVKSRNGRGRRRSHSSEKRRFRVRSRRRTRF